MSLNTYQRARRRALARDGHQCRVCGCSTDLTTHHRIPRALSRDDRTENLVTVCRPCHDTIEALDQLADVLSWGTYLLITPGGHRLATT